MPEDFLLEAFPVSRAECGRVEKAYGFCKAHFRRRQFKIVYAFT